jgi:uncharacterized MnhB-related membrane protein
MQLYRRWNALLGLILAMAAVIAVANLVQGAYVQALLAMAPVVISGVVFATGRVRRWAISWAQPHLVERFPAPINSARIEVREAPGSCPFGFAPQTTWNVDRDGRLSSIICRGATAAIIPVLQDSALPVGDSESVVCRCPFGEQHCLIFEVCPSPPVAVTEAV